MDVGIGTRFKNAWNVFRNRAPKSFYQDSGPGYSYRPDRPRLTRGNERSIINAVYNRIALDVSSIDIRHVDLDENGRLIKIRDSGLNRCLTLEANIDQTGKELIQDIVMSGLDEGCVAIIPTETNDDPDKTNAYDILSLRVGKILDWYPDKVKVSAYNELTGKHEEVITPKKDVSIFENPFYSIMNESNSTMQRLVHKLNLLDAIDEQSSSGKLDLIIQLPYTIRTELKKNQAEERRKSIVDQLTGSRYGIAYIDGTEHITQLNRPVDNNLMKQIEYLTSMLYGQLGITAEIMNGTADDKTMLNYYNRTIEPILAAITNGMKRKFLSKTAITQRQSIEYFRDPFKLVPVSELAEIADKFTRNEILTSNEMRQIIGMRPSKDPNADTLKNKNISSDPSVQQEPKLKPISKEVLNSK